MRDIIVCKFGGTSLADAGCFRRVRDMVFSDARRRYVVVSAPGKRGTWDVKVTDMLIGAYEGDADAQESVRRRFAGIAHELGISDACLDGLPAALKAGRDAAVSRGEYICARLLAEYLGFPFVDAAELFIFRNGRLDAEASYKNLRALGVRAVIPGFYGGDGAGGIVTFPRGGSDISAAHVSAALSAGLYENWTDVDGFYTADPLLVPEARHIERLDYGAACLFASLGAGVIHCGSIAPAARAGVPIMVRNTFAPDAGGTLIHGSGSCGAVCVAVRRCLGGSLISCAGVGEAAAVRLYAAEPSGRLQDGVFSVRCPDCVLCETARKLHAALLSA